MSKKQREKVEEEVSFHQAQNRVSLFEVVFVPVQFQAVSSPVQSLVVVKPIFYYFKITFNPARP
jgi:hypothetical protein